MKNKIFSLVIAFSMLLGAVPSCGVFAFEDGAKTESILIGETFNDIITGGLPENVFAIKRAGDGDLSVENKPDSKNKSLFLSCGTSGTAYIEKELLNPEKAPLTLSFKMMLENKGSFGLVNIVDNDGSIKPTFDVQDGKIILGDETLYEFDTDKWYYIEMTFNTSEKTYSLSVDNTKIIKKEYLSVVGFNALRFQLSATKQELYIDDITLYRADLVTGEREYFPGSRLFLENILQTEAEDIAAKGLLMYQSSDRAVKNGTSLELKTPPISVDKVIYLPLRFTAENLGGEVTWNSGEQAAFLMFEDKTYKLQAENSVIYSDNSPVEIEHKIINNAGTMYIAAEDIATIMNVPLYLENGFVMIDGEEALYKNAVDLVRNEVKNMIKYPRPDSDDVYSAITSRFPNNQHPRLHGSAADFERIKELISTDLVAMNMYNYLVMSADRMIGQPVTKRVAAPITEDDAVRERLKTLSFVWRISGDTKYAERCWKEIEAVLKWEDWYAPYDPLVASAIVDSMGFAYDWLYDWLSEEQRTQMKTNMKEKVLDYYMQAFTGEIVREGNGSWAFWIDDPRNFNPAFNRAILSTSISLLEEYPEFCSDLIAYAIRSLEVHYNHYEPDGAWDEGPDYGYSTLCSSANIVSILATALGTDCGFGTAPGLRDAAYYYQHILGPTGFFNFSDAGKQTSPSYTYSFLFADYLQDPDLGYYRNAALEEDGYETIPEELFYYRPELVGEKPEGLELDQFFRRVETATLRSSWDDDAIFAGIHSSDNSAEHGHLDMGTFVLDANGEEWICDNLRDSYLYSTMTYTTYRTRAEGHSTLVIDDTPYTFAPSEEGSGYLNYKTYDFQDYENGYTMPQSNSTDELRTTCSGTGVIEIRKDSANLTNKYMYLQSGLPADNKSAFCQLNFPSPYVSSGVELSFKMMLEDTDWIDELTSKNWQFPEIGGDGEYGYNFPFLLYTNGLYIRTKNSDVKLLSELKAGVWYEFAMTFDVKNNKLSVSVKEENGESVQMDGLTPKYGLTNVKMFRISPSGNTRLDDIVMKVHPDELEMALTTARRYDQERRAIGYIDEFESKPRGAYAITDISEAYPEQAESAVRGIMLGEDRSAVIVRDEVKLKKKSDIYWFAQMRAAIDVTISDDGKSAILEQNGKKMWVGIISDGDYKIEVMDATPLPGAPNPPEQMPNTDIQRLAVIGRGVMDMNLSVAFIPLGSGETAPKKIPQAVALADWSIPDGEMPKLTSITVDGKLVDGFNEDKAYYNVMLYDDAMYTVPKVDATADSGVKVTVKQASSVPGSAVITAEASGVIKEYTINFIGKELTHTTIRGQDITELNITASSYTDPAIATPDMILDNDITTRWCSEGIGQWIQIDLNNVIELSDLQIAWYQGSERNYSFAILVSEDGKSWKKAYDGSSSGETEELETFAFGATYNARYVRVVCYGHTNGTYNNISEIR